MSTIGDVRSIGLFAVIEMVKDKATKEPLTLRNSPAPGIIGQIGLDAIDQCLDLADAAL